MFGNKLIISSHGYKLTFRESERERKRFLFKNCDKINNDSQLTVIIILFLL